MKLSNELMNKIEKIIEEADFIGLLAMGAPADEYSGESDMFIEWVESQPIILESECIESLHDIFCQQFDSNIAGSVIKYEEAGRKIYDVITKEKDN